MVRAILFITGWGSVLLAIAGAFLPLIPCTPFALLAAACFGRSSPRAMHWLRSSPLLGSALRDWERHRGLNGRAKFTAIALAVSAPLIAYWCAPQLGVAFSCSCLGSLVALVVIGRLPTIRNTPADSSLPARGKRTDKKRLPIAA